MIERRITSSATVILDPMVEGQALDHPFFAINWFNTKWGWLYNFYNHVASGSVSRVDGRVFLKAKVVKTLQGMPSDRRDLLLVVNYPTGEAFLDMLASTYFQVMSILRMLAVKDFSFVLSRRQDGPELVDSNTRKYGGKNAYAIHHFRSDAALGDEITRITGLIADRGISLHFASGAAATVSVRRGEGAARTMPFVTQKVVLFEGATADDLEDFLSGPAYREFTAGLEFSYIGALERLM